MRASERIPEPDGMVHAPTSERPAIRAEGYAIHHPRMPFEDLFVGACNRIPQEDGIVRTPAGKRPPIRTERYVADPSLMLSE